MKPTLPEGCASCLGCKLTSNLMLLWPESGNSFQPKQVGLRSARREIEKQRY